MKIGWVVVKKVGYKFRDVGLLGSGLLFVACLNAGEISALEARFWF
jgi:hypothetical protein